MDVEAPESRPSKRKKKEKRHKRSKSKSKKKHQKRKRKSSSPFVESNHSDDKAQELAETEVDHDFTHQEAVNFVRKTLDSLLSSDPLLDDLPTAVTLEEVKSLIALEHGQAIHVEIYRADGTSLPVIIHQNATVAKLKRAVERATELKLSRDGHHRRRRISWKYVWKTYWLYAHSVKLKDDSATLKDCAITNNDRVSFIKRLNEK